MPKVTQLAILEPMLKRLRVSPFSKPLNQDFLLKFREHPWDTTWEIFRFLTWLCVINSVIYFPGKNCQTVLAPCSPNPCENAAVCKESPNFESYTCLCAPGWQGNNMGVEKPRTCILSFKQSGQVIRSYGRPCWSSEACTSCQEHTGFA